MDEGAVLVVEKQGRAADCRQRTDPCAAERQALHLVGRDKTAGAGLESKDDAFIRFRPEYYLYAIVFLIFDVEAIFLLPFAVAFTGLTVGASIAMLIFLLLLVEGLVWTWRKGVLTWV